MRTLSYIWMGQIVLCVILMQGLPSQRISKRFAPDFLQSRSLTSFTSSHLSMKQEHKSFRSVFKYLKTNQFITMWSMTFLTINMSTFTIGNFQQYGREYIHDQEYFVLVGSVGSVCASLRFFWSLPVDYLSFKVVYGVMIFV